MQASTGKCGVHGAQWKISIDRGGARSVHGPALGNQDHGLHAETRLVEDGMERIKAL